LTTTLETIAGQLNEVYNGALAETFEKEAPSVTRLQDLGLVKQEKKTAIRWPAVSSSPGNASTIPDGGTLPSADEEELEQATLPYKIFLKLARVGRLLQIASSNGSQEFFKTAEGIDMLTEKINRFIPWIAKTIHEQIVANATAVATDIVCLGDAIGKNNNTYAGINRVTDTYWQPYVNANAGVNRTLTAAMLEDMVTNLVVNRGAKITEVWCGDTAWRATRTIINTISPSRNHDPEILRGGAKMISWEGIPFLNMKDVDANAQFWMDLSGEENGIILYRQTDQDLLIRPESTNSYDDRMSVSAHYQLVCRNPRKHGALLDVA